MVEINNQRKAFLDMLAWSEGTDNGRQKTRNHGYDVIVGRRAIYWLLRSPSQTCHAKPKTQINRRRTLPASFPLVGCLPQQLGLKTSLRKVRTLWHCSRLRSVALYLWLIVVISVRQSTIAAISGLHCRALVMVSSNIKADSLIAKFKEAGRTVRDWCMSRVTAIISALVICIIVCLSWAVNHYRDNAITYKAQRDKNARELKLANAAITDAGCVSVMLRDAKYTKELAMLKAENDALRDDVAAGRRRLHIKAVISQCVKPPASGMDNAASPTTGRRRWTGLFHPQREADHYAKTTGRNPEVY